MSGGVPAVSPAAVELIIACEITSRAVYEAGHDRPAWPGESSGVTIGIGYDLGYVDAAQFRADWQPHWPDAAARDRLAACIGIRGSAAHAAATTVADLRVPYLAAETVFYLATLPRYAAQTAAAFPGADRLPPDAFGALVSLVYNRGASMGSIDDPPPDRRREMRGIRHAVETGRYRLVPPLLLDMRRLWPDVAGLRSRRAQEAALFAESLPPIA